MTIGIALFALAGVVAGANAIKVESTTATAGQQDVLVRVLVDNENPVMGISFAARVGTGATFDRMTLEGTLLADDNIYVDFYKPIAYADVVGLGVLLGVEVPPQPPNPDPTYDVFTLPAGTNQYVLALYFDIAPGLPAGREIAIDVRDDLRSTSDAASPVVAPVLTVDGQTVTPGMVDGKITIVGPPDLVSVAPVKGSKDGGTLLTLTGTSFTADTTATIGGLALGAIQFVSPTTLRGTTPAHAVGAVSITVTNPLGSDTLPDAFTYEDTVVPPPTIASVNPNTGAGDVDVTITGTNFTSTADMTVTFGGTPATNLNVVSATELTVHLPACGATQGAWVAIQVTTSGGTATLAQGYFCEGGVPKVYVFTGNANGTDSTVNIADAVFVLAYLFAKQTSPPCMKAADSNDDDQINIADAIDILNYLFGSGPNKPMTAPDRTQISSPACQGYDPSTVPAEINAEPGCATQCTP